MKPSTTLQSVGVSLLLLVLARMIAADYHWLEHMPNTALFINFITAIVLGVALSLLVLSTVVE